MLIVQISVPAVTSELVGQEEERAEEADGRNDGQPELSFERGEEAAPVQLQCFGLADVQVSAAQKCMRSITKKFAVGGDQKPHFKTARIKTFRIVGFNVFIAAVINVAIFWDIASCRLHVIRRFGEPYHLQLQVRESAEQENSA
jgi:hypothetical protein